MRNRLFALLALVAAAGLALWLHGLELDAGVGDRTARRGGVRLEALEGWSYRHRDAESGRATWQIWGRRAQPADAGGRRWKLEAPRLVAFALGRSSSAEQAHDLIASAAHAEVLRGPNGAARAHLSGGVHLEWGELTFETERLAVDAERAHKSALSAAIRIESPVALEFGTARLEAAAAHFELAKRVLVLEPPVELNVPRRALERLAHDEANQAPRFPETLELPGLPAQPLEEQDTLQVLSDEPLELIEAAPGHLQLRFHGPLDAAIRWAEPRMPPAQLHAARGACTLALHPIAATTESRLALEALSLERPEIELDRAHRLVAHRLETDTEARFVFTGEPLRMRFGESVARCRTLRFDPTLRSLDASGALQAHLEPEAGQPVAAIDLEAERLSALLDAAYRPRRLVLLGRHRFAQIAIQQTSGAPLEAEAERITLERIDKEHEPSRRPAPFAFERLRVRLDALAPRSSRARVQRADERVLAHRITFDGATRRFQAHGLVELRRAGALARADSLRGELAEPHGSGTAPGIALRQLALGGERGIEAELDPAVLLDAKPPQSGSRPLRLRAASLEFTFDPATSSAGERMIPSVLEARADPHQPLRLENVGERSLSSWLRAGSITSRPGSTPREPEWLEASAFHFERRAGQLLVTGPIRAVLRLPLSSHADRSSVRVALYAARARLAFRELERLRLERAEFFGAPDRALRVETLEPPPLALRLGWMQSAAERDRLRARTDPEWFEASELVFEPGEDGEAARIRAQTVRARVIARLPSALARIAGGGRSLPWRAWTLEAGRLEIRSHTTRATAALSALQVDVRKGFEAKSSAERLRAGRLHYDGAKRLLELSGAPIEIELEHGRRRSHSSGRVRVRLAE